MMDFGLRGLDLSDAQKEQVRTIMDSHKDEFQQIGTRMRDAQRAFAEATRADTIDEAAIRAKATAVAAVMADEAILRAKVHGEVAGILTAEQQEQLKTRREQMQQKRRPQGR
jgi:protein CpxP